jgi:thiol-disulfide isomerase/thioredoxin
MYLSAAIVLIGALCLLNLVLLLGLLRRLRRGDALDGRSFAGTMTAQGLTLGRKPAPFGVRTLEGQELTEAHLAGNPALVGFFSPGCKPCSEQAPKFAALAARWPGGSDRVFVVIADDSPAAAEYARQFEGIAQRVIDGVSGQVCTAYGVTAFPAFGLLDEDGAVAAEGTTVDSLPAPVPAV